MRDSPHQVALKKPVKNPVCEFGCDLLHRPDGTQFARQTNGALMLFGAANSILTNQGQSGDLRCGKMDLGAAVASSDGEALMSNDEWFTPPNIIAAVRDVQGEIDLDPASCLAAQRNVQASTYYTIMDDALNQPWWGRIFMNPPFSRGKIGRFIDKLLQGIASGQVIEAIVLVDNCADTKWFRRATRVASMMCFTEGRIRFINSEG